MTQYTTADVNEALKIVDQQGLAVLTGALDTAQLKDTWAKLEQAVQASNNDGVPTRNYAFDPDALNQRVFYLFNHNRLFVDLISDARALSFVRHLLDDDFLISNFSANITEPGNARMQLHADQGYVLPPWPAQPLACNVAWVLSDFSAMTGGTEFVPDSHRFGHGPEPDQTYQTVPVEAPAGSLLVMDGRLWHQTGVNQSRAPRAALFGYYVRRWLRPQINWNAALWPQTVDSLEAEFLHLLGYYSGNVEFQIPLGRAAPVSVPDELETAADNRFALGHD